MEQPLPFGPHSRAQYAHRTRRTRKTCKQQTFNGLVKCLSSLRHARNQTVAYTYNPTAPAVHSAGQIIICPLDRPSALTLSLTAMLGSAGRVLNSSRA